MDERINEKFYKLVDRYDVADFLEIKEKSLRYFLYAIKPDNMYTDFTIAKRHGGTRLISAPDEKLKQIQRKLAHNLENVYEPKVCAYGFINNKNICGNAKKHQRSNQILNIDLKDYFTQINFGRVRGMFISKPYSIGEEAATVLSQIICYKGKLPQGAPTSPIVANMICAPMDNHFMKLAKEFHMQYTRYADDITFSVKGTFPKEIVYIDDKGNVVLGSKIIDILHKDGFRENNEKIHLRNKNERQEVTGLIVNKIVNVRREYIKEVRAILHNYETKGFDQTVLYYVSKYKNDINVSDMEKALADEKLRRKIEEWFDNVIKGKINFIKDVRGDSNPIFIKYANQFNQIRKQDIFKLDEYEFMKKIEHSVFILRNNDESVQGTGFILKDIGLVTNYHVTENGDFYNVITYKKDSIGCIGNELNLLKRDKIIDYASYKIYTEFESWEIGDSDVLKIGDKLRMISYPDYTTGDYPNIQNIEITGEKIFMNNLIKTVSGRIVHGSSGGIIINDRNQVVGVINSGPAKIEQTEDTIIQGFIPINAIVKDIVGN